MPRRRRRREGGGGGEGRGHARPSEDERGSLPRLRRHPLADRVVRSDGGGARPSPAPRPPRSGVADRPRQHGDGVAPERPRRRGEAWGPNMGLERADGTRIRGGRAGVDTGGEEDGETDGPPRRGVRPAVRGGRAAFPFDADLLPERQHAAVGAEERAALLHGAGGDEPGGLVRKAVRSEDKKEGNRSNFFTISLFTFVHSREGEAMTSTSGNVRKLGMCVGVLQEDDWGFALFLELQHLIACLGNGPFRSPLNKSFVREPRREVFDVFVYAR